eukprot:886356-Rhodomonas_salina.1
MAVESHRPWRLRKEEPAARARLLAVSDARRRTDCEHRKAQVKTDCAGSHAGSASRGLRTQQTVTLLCACVLARSQSGGGSGVA